MLKGQKIEDKHAKSWVEVLLGAWMETHSSLVISFFTSLFFFSFASFLYSLKPYFFSTL
jgi:hypothetical protein